MSNPRAIRDKAHRGAVYGDRTGSSRGVVVSSRIQQQPAPGGARAWRCAPPLPCGGL